MFCGGITRRAFLGAAGAAAAAAATTGSADASGGPEIFGSVGGWMDMPAIEYNGPMVASDMAPELHAKIHCNLVICMDGSASMREQGDNFHLQVEGTASALESEQVGSVIEHCGGIGVTSLVFGKITKQATPWAFVKDRSDARRYASLIRAAESQYTGGGTYISHGLMLSKRLLQDSPFDSRNATVDVSGDGILPNWEKFLRVMMQGLAKEEFARVNGIAMCDKVPELDSYFQKNIVTSEDVYNATGVPMGRTWKVSRMSDFRDVMVQKFMNDIAMIEPSHIVPYAIKGFG